MSIAPHMEESLIEKVKEHEILYNKGFPDYRNLIERQKAWEKIGKDLKLPADDCKRHWDKLRRRFCNYRSRPRPGQSNSAISYKMTSVWKFTRQMSFLVPFLVKMKPTGRHSSCINESPASDTLENDTLEDDTLEDDTLEDDTMENDTLGNDSSAAQSENQSEESEGEENSNLHPEQELLHTGLEMLKDNSASLKRRYGQRNLRSDSLLETLDETDMFFLSMSRMTKQLPKLEQTRIKLALSNSVLSAEQTFVNAKK